MTADSVKVNREYKDRLFRYIFGNPEYPEWTLSLYNALNSSSYTDPQSIRITTIKEAVYMNMKNDIDQNGVNVVANEISPEPHRSRTLWYCSLNFRAGFVSINAVRFGAVFRIQGRENERAAFFLRR